MEVMHHADNPSSINFDPLLDSYQDLEFLNDIQYQDLIVTNNVCFTGNHAEYSASNVGSTLSSDSIIDFELYEDQDINFDILLNQDLDFQDDLSHIQQDDNQYLFEKSESNLRVNFKKSRKNKQKSILPMCIKDIDNVQQLNGRSNLKNEDLINGKPGNQIHLSKEERELLIRDGFTVPTHFPLTKSEERALKTIRRKIRNKISAKNSRAKKENYVEGLEQRIFICTKENSMLRMKLAETEKDKMNLYQQVVALQKHLAKFLPNSTTSSTSLMLLLLTFLVILTPTFDPRKLLTNYNINTENTNEKNVLPGRSRMLLQISTELGEPYLISLRPSPPWQVPPKSPILPSLKSIKNIRENNVLLKITNASQLLNFVNEF